jgi:predicted house-cleaning NTP pyrophosphatase (Maf/HAM1 superfamily)
MLQISTQLCAVAGDVVKSSTTTTLVEFGKLSDAAIAAYIATGVA